MTSHTTERFRRAFQALSPNIQRRARVAYARFRENPYHPSLQFKQVHSTRPIFSARVGLGYRALGTKQGEVIVGSGPIRSMIDSPQIAKAANSSLHPTACAGVGVGKGKVTAPAAGERGR